MPTYDYVCEACEHKFEEYQAMSDAPLQKCPQCKKKKLRRLFGTGAAVIFKGSGFYQTDYRSESYQAAARADQEAGKPKASESTESAKPSEAPKSADTGKGKTSGKNAKS